VRGEAQELNSIFSTQGSTSGADMYLVVLIKSHYIRIDL
jgi:hypothetical protein